MYTGRIVEKRGSRIIAIGATVLALLRLSNCAEHPSFYLRTVGRGGEDLSWLLHFYSLLKIFRRALQKTPQAAARMIFCFFARELGFPTIETGKYLGIQQAAVSKAARKGAVIAEKERIKWGKNE
jgi:hypothetical protein